MRKIILVKLRYFSDNAPLNRLLALAKGLYESENKVDVLFLLPNKQKEKYTKKLPDGIAFSYMWDENNLNKKRVRLCKAVRNIYNHIQKGSNVVLMSYSLPLLFVLSVKRINLYIERTEAPAIFFSGKLTGKIKEHLYVYLAKKAKSIFVISNNIKSYFERKGIASDKIKIVNMVVDPQRFSNTFKGIHEQDFEYIGYCGTVSNAKDGVNILIEAFSHVLRKYPALKLLIAGKKPYFKDNKLNDSIIEKFNMTDSVHFMGELISEEMPGFLTKAKILALSRPESIQASAGFPTKLGEYLCTGKPVVVTRTGEIDMYLENMKNIVFAEPDNVEDFSQRLLWVLDNYEKALKIADEGRKLVLTTFSYKVQAKVISDTIYG
ncbi:MAG: glycosyltransferase family 4 protein [Fibrobacter sp.]|nr:glycosyltransferase family 4 protein [Fibrobacter sp.]